MLLHTKDWKSKRKGENIGSDLDWSLRPLTLKEESLSIYLLKPLSISYSICQTTTKNDMCVCVCILWNVFEINLYKSTCDIQKKFNYKLFCQQNKKITERTLLCNTI